MDNTFADFNAGGVSAGHKHSGLGIASFIVSLVGAVAMFIAVCVAGYLEASTPGGLDEKSPQAVIVGLLILAFLFVSLVALGLGIASLFQKDRNKLFGILGTIFSLLTVLGTFALLVIGSHG